MSEKNQLFAFVAGEVAPEFYGRRDLAKFPLALSECENFFVDFRGGLINRPGTEFIAMLPRQAHAWATFSTRNYDLALLFLESQMYVLRDGLFVLTDDEVSGTADATGTISVANSFSDGQLVSVEHDTRRGIYLIDEADANGFSLRDASGGFPTGPVTVTSCYTLSVPYDADALPNLRFYQEGPELVVTVRSHAPATISYNGDADWSYAAIASNIPDAPAEVRLSASATGTAHYSYIVTAVVDGVESGDTAQAIATNAVNFTTTTGYVEIDWDAVPDAEMYYIYRTVVFPRGPYPEGSDHGYIGKTSGLAFTDGNITPDFTKSPPKHATWWENGNYPTTYSRFQQRGYFAGMENDPLGIAASIAGNRDSYVVSNPPVASDAFHYELDSQTGKPIHSLLPLRYGLMIFDSQGITQLKGSGQSTAVSATDAFAEVQGYTSVAPIQPIAINLDVLYTTELFSEVNAMEYTEYTNSFKTKDILILSSHLFGLDRQITKMSWLPEPHKQVIFSRSDGQLVSLTYEASQDVYGWSRFRTRGDYISHTMLRERKHCVLYHSIHRRLRNTEVMSIERDMPRFTGGYDSHWFVDCGGERKLVRPDSTVRAVKQGPGELDDWLLTSPDGLAWASPNLFIYIQGRLFRIESVDNDEAVLRPLADYPRHPIYDRNELIAGPNDWGYNTPDSSFTGLWWLEGEEVSVQLDGDFWLSRPVTNGEVSVDGSGARALAGLPYECVARTLSLGLPDYMIEGRPVSVRGIAIRQWQSRGLAIGKDRATAEELPARQYEPWGNPLTRVEELRIMSLLGVSGWEREQFVTFLQRYPTPTNILGIAFNLDVGDD